MSQIRLREASPADISLLRTWDERPHIVASNPNDRWDWEATLGRADDWRESLIAERAGRPIGFVEIIDPARDPERYWGEVPGGLRAIDLWIGEESEIGRGHGTEMMRQALARCFADPRVRAVLVDPIADNTRAHRFYERQGFSLLGPRRFGDDDCLVYQIEREKWRAARGG